MFTCLTLPELEDTPPRDGNQQNPEIVGEAPQVPRRASCRRTMPIRPVFAQSRTMRLRFLTFEAPRVHFRAIAQKDRCRIVDRYMSHKGRLSVDW